MNLKGLILGMLKLALGGLVFVIGSILGSMAAGALHLALPELPAGYDPSTGMQTLLISGVLMAAALAALSRQLALRGLARALALGLFAYVAYALNTYLETIIIMPSVTTPYVPVMNLFPCLLSGAVIAWLFPPPAPGAAFADRARAFFAPYSARSWAWRLLGALLVFPAAYYAFGLIVLPFVRDYYETQFAGLAMPTLGQLLPILFLRSLLFLLSILPLVIAWRGDRTRLVILLGAGLFLLVGGIAMLTSSFLPASMRFAHSLEILADSYVHAAGLALLLLPPALALRRAGQAA